MMTYIISVENGSGWMTSLCTEVPVKGTQPCSLSFWTRACQSSSWTVTIGPPFTMHAGQSIVEFKTLLLFIVVVLKAVLVLRSVLRPLLKVPVSTYFYSFLPRPSTKRSFKPRPVETTGLFVYIRTS